MRDDELPAPAVAVAAVSALGGAALGTRLRALAARRFGSDLPGAFVEDALPDTLAWLGTPPPLTGTRAAPAAVMRRGSRGPAA